MKAHGIFFMFAGMFFTGMSAICTQCELYGLAVFCGLMAISYFLYSTANVVAWELRNKK